LVWWQCLVPNLQAEVSQTLGHFHQNLTIIWYYGQGAAALWWEIILFGGGVAMVIIFSTHLNLNWGNPFILLLNWSFN